MNKAGAEDFVVNFFFFATALVRKKIQKYFFIISKTRNGANQKLHIRQNDNSRVAPLPTEHVKRMYICQCNSFLGIQ